jgi:hypothetical protein
MQKLQNLAIPAIFMLILFVIPGKGLSQQNDTLPDNIELISRDSLVNGYYLKNIDPLPFSPVIEPQFNLPDSAIVNLFLTDSLQSDTLWILRDELMSPGLYRISAGIFGNYMGEHKIRTAPLHFEATSDLEDYILNRKESSFRVRYLLTL